MNIRTNLRGRLKNTSLPYKSGLLPLYEAVVNSIHAIEEAGIDSADGRIDVHIDRTQRQGTFEDGDALQQGRGRTPSEDIISFRILDNGIGFNDANIESFKTLDSEHKIDKGCRGVGRLLWLKAFERVSVASVYESENQVLRKRTFQFGDSSGVYNEQDKSLEGSLERQTSVELDGFRNKYQKNSLKTVHAIAESIFEHCFWYFIRAGGCPPITIWDNGETVELDEVCKQHIKNAVDSENLEIKGKRFDINHVKIRSSAHLDHKIAFCAGNRLVTEEKIEGKISGLFNKLEDEQGSFCYVCYVNSDFLDDHVRAERTGFDIEEEYEALFKDIEISMTEIRKLVLEKSRLWLEGYLKKNQQLSQERVNHFISNKAPRYRPIIRRIPESKLIIDPKISDKDLDVLLFKFLAEIEGDLLKQGHEIMVTKLGENKEEYEARIQEYLEKAKDLKASDLANYVWVHHNFFPNVKCPLFCA